jgi:hypothetical protein
MNSMGERQLLKFGVVAKSMAYLFTLILSLSCTKEKPAIRAGPPEQKTAVSSGEKESPGQKLVWAGYQGRPPGWFDAGAKKGKGWQEIISENIRHNLLSSGFHLEYSYLTPSRLHQEMVVRKTPICFYPQYWSDPEKIFACNPS